MLISDDISTARDLKQHTTFGSGVNSASDLSGETCQTLQGNRPGLTQLYLSAMDAIHEVAPGVLFFLEVRISASARLLRA